MKKIRHDDGVFNRIIGNEREISAFDRFINQQKGIRSNAKMLHLLERYKDRIENSRGLFDELSQLEDLIILNRIRENRIFDIYVQQQKEGRQYLYARLACPRESTVNRDIRVCVGRVDAYPADTDFRSNEELMNRADQYICEYLDQLIKEKEYIVRSVIKDLQDDLFNV